MVVDFFIVVHEPEAARGLLITSKMLKTFQSCLKNDQFICV